MILLDACISTSTWNAGFGGCITYTVSNNFNYCNVDSNSIGITAIQACPQCGVCTYDGYVQTACNTFVHDLLIFISIHSYNFRFIKLDSLHQELIICIFFNN